MLKSLQLGKTAGTDSINNRILKELRVPLYVPLSDQWIYFLNKGKVPSLWKEVNVTPIYKKRMTHRLYQIIYIFLF